MDQAKFLASGKKLSINIGESEEEEVDIGLPFILLKCLTLDFLFALSIECLPVFLLNLFQQR